MSTTLDTLIDTALVAENKKREDEHKLSGKLSASMLGDPLQVQILKAIGVPQKPVDEYTLRKFLRGNHVEEWFVNAIPTVEKQKHVEYRDAHGYADAIVDTKDWDHPVGIIPLEVKSVTNLKFKRIESTGQADRSHKLQAGFYALSEGTTAFAIAYVASDDYRTRIELYETAEVAQEIEDIITRFDAAKKDWEDNGKLPAFEAEEKWMADPKYAKFPDFITLSPQQAAEKASSML